MAEQFKAGKFGTVCMVGTFTDGKFKAHKDTTIGTITQRSMLNICGVENVDVVNDAVLADKRHLLMDKLTGKVKQNINALYNQLSFIGSQPEALRMFRISSGLLPLFDHPVFGELYNDAYLTKMIDNLLSRCKRVIDAHNIRVCTHPDQYVVINSHNADVRSKSINALRYHVYFMSRLTDASSTSINVHLNGRLDHLPEFDAGECDDLIPWLSLENEDKGSQYFVGDVFNTLDVCEKYGLKMLLDLHHHYALTGDLISINDGVIVRIVRTWGTSRPIMHVSQGKTEPTDRAHSDFINDCDLIDYIEPFSYIADIEVEAKAKHNAVVALCYECASRH